MKKDRPTVSKVGNRDREKGGRKERNRGSCICLTSHNPGHRSNSERQKSPA